jgi:protein TonB
MINTKAHKTRGPLPTADNSTDRVDDLLGAVVPLRAREVPPTSEQSDLSNVIPFRRNRAADKDGDAKPAPCVVCNQTTRPCPFLAGFDWRKQWPLLLLGSVAVHASVFAWFMQEPPAKASIGLEVISVEMVLGAHSEAGIAQTPGDAAVESAYSPDLGKPDDTNTELTDQPIKEVKEETKPEVQEEPKPAVEEETKPQMQAAAPPEPLPEPELAVDPEPNKETPVEAVKEIPMPVAKPVKEKGKAKRQRIAAPSQHSVAANSIGRGRSDADTNYRGRVIAHLSRHKQFPAEARNRGDTGVASVTFSISGSGAVTSVRLARSSGSSILDREVQAMVRRASPFPPPPSGQSLSFTAPVNFNLR